MAAGTVEAKLVASSTEFQAGINQAVAAVRALSDEMKKIAPANQPAAQSIGAFGAAAREGATHTNTLFESMRTMSREARQHDRVFNYYGRNLAALTGEAKGTAAAFVGIGAALASGMWIVAGIEAIKLLTEKFTEAKKEATKFAKEASKEIEQLAQKSENLTRSIAGIFEKSSEQFKLEKIQRTREEIERLTREEKTLGDVRAAAISKDQSDRREEPSEAARRAADGYAAVKQRIKEVKAEFKEMSFDDNKEYIAQLQKAVDLQGKKRSTDAARTAQVSAQNAEIEHNKRMLALNAELLEGEAKLEAEFEAKKAEIRARADTTEEQDDAEIGVQRLVTDKKIEKARADLRIKVAEEREKANADAAKAEIDGRNKQIDFERIQQFTREANGDAAKGREIAALDKHYREQIALAEGNLDEQLRLQREFGEQKAKLLQGDAQTQNALTRDLTRGIQGMFEDAFNGGGSIDEMFAALMRRLIAKAAAQEIMLRLGFKIPGVGNEGEVGFSALSGLWKALGLGGGGGPNIGAGGALGSALPIGGTLGLEHFAGGGNFSGLNPIVVGERGPEVVSFGRSGTVTPNDALGGGGVTNNFHFPNALFVDRRAIEDFGRQYGRDFAKGMRG